MSSTTTTYDTFLDAIRSRKQVSCTYQGHIREVCPHVIGHKNGRMKVLTFQFAGGSSSGLPADGNWRCMFIDEVEILQVRDGIWHTGENHSRPQTCVDEIDEEVAF